MSNVTIDAGTLSQVAMAIVAHGPLKGATRTGKVVTVTFLRGSFTEKFDTVADARDQVSQVQAMLA